MRIRALSRHALVAAAASITLCTNAWGQSSGAAPAPPQPDWTLASNVGVFSQYVFRGVSQTNEKPALQGGFDLAHRSGLYLGTWASNISWLSDAAPVSASLEWDFYGGYKGSLPLDLGYDIGALYYYYPGRYPVEGYTRPDTLELYAGLSWKFLSAKYSSVAGNRTFGFPDSRGSDYLELNASYDIAEKLNDVFGKVTLIAHVGHQRFRHFGDFNYTDWKIGAATEVLGLTAGVAFTSTNATDALYTNPFGKKIAGNQFVAYIQKTF